MSASDEDAYRTDMSDRVALIEAKVERIEHELAKNTATTEEIRDSTRDLVVLVKQASGFFAILERISKIFVPILKLGAAIATFWATFKFSSSWWGK